MTFNFELAKSIVAHYRFLIGQELDTGLLITHLLIVPSEPTQFQIFMSVFNQTGDNQTALSQSGIDANTVNILVVHHDTWGGNVLTSDIDKYLTRKDLNKV